MDTNQPTSLDQPKTETTFPSSDNDEKIVSLNDITHENGRENVSDNDEGFVSGDEGIVDDDNSDLPFVDAPATVESLVDKINDDQIISESTEKFDVSLSDIGEVLDVNDSNSVGDFNTKEDVKSDSVDVKFNDERDSKVDSINDIKVDVAVPGVVVVGETKENDEDVSDYRSLVTENSKVEESSVDDKLIDGADSIVDTIDDIKVDLAAPGVIVGETEECEVAEDNREVDVGENFVLEEVESKREESSDVEVKEDVTSDEGDSTIDTISGIHVDLAAPGVVVVGETKENEDVGSNQEAGVVEPEKEELFGGDGDVKVTAEGDSIVDTIQVESVAPGVAVVGEVEENEVEKVELEVPIETVGEPEDNSKSVEESVSIPSTENKFDILKQNTQSENLEVCEEKICAGAVIDSDAVGVEKSVKEGEAKHGPAPVIANGVSENGFASKSYRDGEIEIKDKVVGFGTMQSNSEHSGVDKEVEIVGKTVGLDSDGNQLESTNADTIKSNGVHPGEDGEVEFADKTVDLDIDVKPKNTNTVTVRSNGFHSGDEANPNVSDREADDLVFGSVSAKKFIEELEQSGLDSHTTAGNSLELSQRMDGIEFSHKQITGDEANPNVSDREADDLVFGSESAKKFIEELEQSGLDSHTTAGNSLELSQRMDGQIVTDSEEEGDSDDDDGKELFDPSALAAIFKAASDSNSGGGSFTISSQDGSRLFSVERPAGMGSSLQALRPTPQSTHLNVFSPSALYTGMEPKENLSEEEKTKLEKLQQIRVKFLRLVHKLGLSTEEPVAEQVLYRLALLGGRRSTQSFNLEAAHLESKDGNDLNFSVKILVIGKSGVGKSATINSIFGEEKASIDAFEAGTSSVKEVNGYVHGVNISIVDTPGLKSSVTEQGFNQRVLSNVQKLTKKSPPDVVLYVDRLDAQTRDLNDLPMLKTVTSTLGPSIWQSAIVTLTHGSSAPPDGPSGTALSYDEFVSQRSRIVQQSIGYAMGDVRVMGMNPVSLAENHLSCRKNRDGQKILPNGQVWRSQLLLLCYSMKILSEASALSKAQDPFDHMKLFGYRTRSLPLPYMLSSMLQSRPHPKLLSDQSGDGVDSDVDLDNFSDSDGEEEDEYDQLPPFKPLKKRQISKLSKEHRKAYFEEYDYRVKLLQKKSWREELKRIREMKRRGKDSVTDYSFNEEDPDSGASAPIAVPLPDLTLPASFDGDNPAYRYRFLEPTSQFLARPVLNSHGWDHDCGYEGVNLQHGLVILNRFPASYTVQVSKDKKEFTFSLDSSISAKHGDKMSSMAGFDVQSMGKQFAYIFRGETKFKNLKKNKAVAGLTFTVLGENIIPGIKIEDQITLGKQYILVGSAGAVKSQQETAYGANFELQRMDADYPIGQVQSTVSMSLVKWRGDLALGLNALAQFTVGRNSKVAVRAGINNKMSGQVTVRTSSSEHLSLALAAVLPTVLSVYRKLYPARKEKYSHY